MRLSWRTETIIVTLLFGSLACSDERKGNQLDAAVAGKDATTLADARDSGSTSPLDGRDSSVAPQPDARDTGSSNLPDALDSRTAEVADAVDSSSSNLPDAVDSSASNLPDGRDSSSADLADALDSAPASSTDAQAAAGYVDPLLANGQTVPSPVREGMQYSGAVALRSATVAPTGNAWVEISAPILPKTPALYPGQGDNYPTTPQAQAKLAHDSALTFETLLAECQPKYPGIVLWRTGEPPLSSEQVNTNFRLLEDCAYLQYLAKPYWIPQLIKDVDICRQELGVGWHLLTENEVLALSASDLLKVQETLAGLKNPGSSQPGSFLFSQQVWVLRNDGSVTGANLQPDATPRFVPLSSSGGMPYDPRVHYEGGLALRCLRVTAGG